MSLANSFDVKDPQDFLRGLSNALNEYDQNKDDGERLKMVRQLFQMSTLLSSLVPRTQVYLSFYFISYKSLALRVSFPYSNRLSAVTRANTTFDVALQG